MDNAITVRKMNFPFGADIPKYWFLGSPLATHMSNSLNLVFPAGERFFVRSVRYYLDQLDDPVLLDQVKAFFGQEGSHAREHERFFEILEGQGYDIRSFLAVYDRWAWKILEPRFAPVLRLSTTVALEHFTAMFAENALDKGVLDDIHPTMRDLLKWHAAEEIEHKAVAFDVLQAVDPRYRVRITGLVLATAGLLLFWTVGTTMLMKQEGFDRAEVLRQLRVAVSSGRIGNGDMRRAFVQYLRRDFHPSHVENYHLAANYLRSIGRKAA